MNYNKKLINLNKKIKKYIINIWKFQNLIINYNKLINKKLMYLIIN